jgi:hypothetical protein
LRFTTEGSIKNFQMMRNAFVGFGRSRGGDASIKCVRAVMEEEISRPKISREIYELSENPSC